MAQHIFEVLREYVVGYGYWAVGATLLLENAGLPVPGETVLLLASFLAYSQRTLHLPTIILVATCAAVGGDNLGYWIGNRGGRTLLDHYQHMRYMRPTTIEHGERLFRRYGATTIFFARFIAGVRIVAGPLAGALRMDWPRFALWNLLGGIVWVTLISLLGYFLGGSWDTLVRVVKHLHLSAILIASAAIVVLWWRHRRTSGQRR